MPCLPRLPLGRTLALALLALLGTGCFEESVKERLHIDFRADAKAEVEVSVELRHDVSDEPEIQGRLDELEEDWLGGFDPWTLRFERLRPTSEDFYWQKREGRLAYASRLAVVDDLASLEELFADTAVSLAIEVTDDTIDFGLYPGPSGRAGRRERRRVEKLLDDWAVQVAEYLEAGDALYRYLDQRPERASRCFAELFDIEPEEKTWSVGDAALSPLEEGLVETLGEAMGEVFAILLETEGADTLDQIIARVYDPFPAPLTIALPVTPESVEGFEPSDEGWRVPLLTPWAALERLGDRWLSPEPVLAYVAAAKSGDDAVLDIAAFVDGPRHHATPPDAEEVRTALEDELEAVDAYRLVWRRPPVPSDPPDSTEPEPR